MASSQRMSSTLARVPKFATTPYVCATCRSRSQFQLPSRPDTQQARSNSDIPFTEKLRRKIWGTDNPPGLKDPYGGPSFLERRLAQRKQRRGEVEEATEVPPEPTDVGSTRFPTPQSEETQSPTTSRSRRGRSYNPHGFESATPAPVRPPTYLGPRPYRKAETWEGLEWLGHRGEYQFQDPKEADEYTPWLDPSERLEQLDETEVWEFVGAALVEITGSTEAEADASALSLRKLEMDNLDAPIYEVLKAFQRMISLRLPDPLLNRLAQNPEATYGDLVAAVLEFTAPKPQKVNDYLVANDALLAQANVKVSAKKVLPSDKEKALGRWKVIEGELLKRGLPVFGRADGGRNPWDKDERSIQ